MRRKRPSTPSGLRTTETAPMPWAGGVVDPLPEDAPFFVKDYYDYYKTERGYHPRAP